jgi:hypothetical protein
MTHVLPHLAGKSRRKPQTSAILQHTRAAPSPPATGPKERYIRIAEVAYLRAERRGFLSGYEMQDWLEAEAEVGQLLTPAI